MPRTRTRGARVLSSLLAVLAAVSLAACSDDDDGDEASTATTVATTPTTPTTRVYTGDSNSVFCTLARQNVTRVSQISGAVTDPAQLTALLNEVAPAVREIVDVSPPELEDDMEILADGFEQLLESSKEGQFDLNVLTDPEFLGAGQNLQAYASQVCGIVS
jgi:hypothetical protein